jgi:hypothetical protein
MDDSPAPSIASGPTTGFAPALAVAAWLAAALLTLGLAARWTGDAPPVTREALEAIGAGGSVAALWLAAALGLGVTLRKVLGLERKRFPVRTPLLGLVLGVAAMLSLDSLLATLGLLGAAGGLGAWGVVAFGIVLLVRHLRDLERGGEATLRRRVSLPTLVAFAAGGPPAGILLLAAASEPGFLWSSEFGGYDALSYHLQLPKEWMQLGRLATLEHNVYSAFPSFVEAAFLHVFLLSGGPAPGAIACQMLVAFLTLAAAATVGTLAAGACPPATRPLGFAVGAVAYLGTPWTVVVGSLAYNDGVVALLLAGGFLLVRPLRGDASWRTPAALGLVAGAACGAKLSAVGFVAVPAALVAVACAPRRKVVAIATFALAAAIPLVPWLARNALATGNPVFPFATGLFGTGWWTLEQAETFRAAHGPAGGPVEGLGRLVGQWLAYGWGDAPLDATGRPEPWKPLWSALPALGLVGVATLAFAGRRRLRANGGLLAATLVVQAAFWLFLTHRQSRFLLPSAVPLAIATGGLVRLLGKRPAPAARAAVALLAVAFGLAVPWTYSREGRIGEVHAPSLFVGGLENLDGRMTLRLLDAEPDLEKQAATLALAPRAFWTNFWIPQITGPDAPDAKVLLLGEAAPFRIYGNTTYATVWDRGPLERLAEDPGIEPGRWAERLRGQGYRFAIIDLGMLDRWAASGWLDPNLAPERMGAFLRSVTVVQTFPNRSLLVDLAPPPPQLPAGG